jgi:hypothetical protein
VSSQYAYDSSDVHLHTLSKEVEGELPGLSFTASVNSTNPEPSLVFVFELALSAGDLVTLSDAIDDHKSGTSPLKLSAYKSEKHDQIDVRSNELTFISFDYDGKTFSSSRDTVLKTSTAATVDLMGSLPYPLNISTLDGEPYSLVDQAAFRAFFLTMFGSGAAHHTSGKALKDQVDAAESCAEVDAVVDDR